MRIIAWVVCGVVLAMLAGCSASVGGSSSSINPSQASLSPGDTLQFSAAFSAYWGVQEANGGTITPQGLYTAPVSAGTYHVTATNANNPGQIVTATVTVGTGGVSGAPLAAPLADAVTMGEPFGAQLVSWGATNSRTLAYLLYRDTNPLAPIAVIDGTLTHYVDSARPLPELGDVAATDTVNITIDPNTGMVLTDTHTLTYDTTLDNIQNPNLTFSTTSLSITAHRVPVQPGDICGYMLRVLYMDYDSGGLSDTSLQNPLGYRLYLGNMSNTSARVTLTPPPPLDSPADGVASSDRTYRCKRVVTALTYTLQFSTDASFSAGHTLTVPAYVDTTDATGTESLSTLWSTFTPGQTVLWRMGARVDGQQTPLALGDPNQNNWVYSAIRTFTLPVAPPPPAKMKGGAARGKG